MDVEMMVVVIILLITACIIAFVARRYDGEDFERAVDAIDDAIAYAILGDDIIDGLEWTREHYERAYDRIDGFARSAGIGPDDRVEQRRIERQIARLRR